MLTFLQSQVVAALSLSLLGGLHCAGMCGGFTGALQIHRPQGTSAARLSLGYHAGRMLSYTLTGALAGAVGAAVLATELLPVQIALLIVGSAMLLAIGAVMLVRRGSLRRLEPIGIIVWRAIAPWSRRVYPPRTIKQAVLAGLAWGFIPCGMVYAALPLALVTGGAWQGALVMAAFGLGTLPNMIALDQAVIRLQKVRLRGGATRRGAIALARPLAGATIVVFGVSGLAHAARVAGAQHPAIEAVASLCHG